MIGECKDNQGISVLIPMYQAGRYIFDAIESVADQTLLPLELIVVDDGSTDDGAVYAREALETHPLIRSQLKLMPHRGQAASRNTALSMATGSWIFYLDADDVLSPNALQDLLACAEANPDAGLVCAQCLDFISPELPEDEKAKLKINTEPYRRMLSGCTMAKREVYDLVGSYDETLPSSETAQWMLRMKDCGIKVANTDAITMHRRYHANNFGRRSRKMQLESYMAIIRQRRARDAEHD